MSNGKPQMAISRYLDLYTGGGVKYLLFALSLMMMNDLKLWPFTGWNLCRKICHFKRRFSTPFILHIRFPSPNRQLPEQEINEKGGKKKRWSLKLLPQIKPNFVMNLETLQVFLQSTFPILLLQSKERLYKVC